jgi:hypothetical protein
MRIPRRAALALPLRLKKTSSCGLTRPKPAGGGVPLEAL